MEIRHRTISDLRLNGYGRSKSDMIAEMQENCEVYNELVAPVTYNEDDFIFEWESTQHVHDFHVKWSSYPNVKVT